MGWPTQNWLRFMFPPNRQQRRAQEGRAQARRAQQSPKRFRPGMERLEDRTVPAQTFSGTSADPALFTALVESFRAGLGGGAITAADHPSSATGYREVTWEEVNNPNAFTGDYFNNLDPRGIAFTVNGSTAGANFKVSDDGFASLDPSYPGTFSSFSPPRLFAPQGLNATTISFTDPLQPPSPHAPATVKGFGVVFSDVDKPTSTSVTIYYRDNNNPVLSQMTLAASAFNHGFSFVGVIFTNGERIDHVDMVTGNRPLAMGNSEVTDPSIDVVAIDNIIYAQPQKADTRVYRWLDSDGNWDDPAHWQQTSGSVDLDSNKRFPNGAGEIAVFGNNLSAARTIALPNNADVAVGAVQIDTAQDLHFTSTGHTLVFSAAGAQNADAALDVTNFSGHDTVTFDAPIQFSNNWQITALAADSRIQFNGVVNDTGNKSITQRGGLVAFGGNGVIHPFHGPLTVLGGVAQIDGTLSNSAVALQGGTLAGLGRVQGVSSQTGFANTIAPGTAVSPGLLTSTANTALNGAATLRIKWRGAAGFDQFQVNGNLILNDAHVALDLGGLDVPAGVPFAFLQVSGTRSGTFAEGTALVVDNQLFFIGYSANGATLTKVATTTTTDLARSPNQDTVFGQSVDFMATVTAQAGAPTGFVHFSILQGNTVIDGGNVDLSAATGTTSTATFTESTLLPGSYTVSAVYMPSGIYQNSQANPLVHAVSPASVAATVTTTSMNAIYSTPTIRAHVQAALPGVGIPSGGVVHFLDTSNNNFELGMAAIDNNGNAVLPGILDVGDYTIAVTFSSGDSRFQDGILANSNILNQHITPANSATLLTSNPATWTVNTPVSLIATVTSPQAPTQIPTGTVEFTLLPNTALGSAPLVNGVATLMTMLDAGPQQTIRAIYHPAAIGNFTTSQTILTQDVNQDGVSINIAPSSSTIVFGQTYSILATISPQGGQGSTPTGQATFTLTSGATIFTSQPISLINGEALLTSNQLPTLPVRAASYSISVAYSGSATYLSKTTVLPNALRVNKANISVVVNPANGIAGQLLQFPAVVSVDAPGNGVPDGMVHFVLTSTNPTVTLDVPLQHQQGQNVALFSSNSLLPGTYAITAQYLDTTGSFNNSTSAAAQGQVDHAAVTLSLDANANSSFGEIPTFTARVMPTSPNFFAVAGQVRFRLLGPVTVVLTGSLANGVASVQAASNLPVGSYQVEATYLGNAVFSPSAPQTINHTRISATTSASVTNLAGNTAQLGKRLSFHAVVTTAHPELGIPNGTVTFTIVKPDGTSNLVFTVPLNANGTADYSPPDVLPPTVGRDTLHVFVHYNGDDSQGRYQPADAARFDQTILRGKTLTTITIVRKADQSAAVRYADPIEVKAVVTVLENDPETRQRAGTPQGQVTFGNHFLQNTTVLLDTGGQARLNSYQGDDMRLPEGAASFTAAYLDNDPTYATFDPSGNVVNIVVGPQKVVTDTLMIRNRLGQIIPIGSTVAVGDVLTFSMHYRFETWIQGSLLDGTPVQQAPLGKGQFQIGSTVSPQINLIPSAGTGVSLATPTQPFSTLTFTSSKVLNTQGITPAARLKGVTAGQSLKAGTLQILVNYDPGVFDKRFQRFSFTGRLGEFIIVKNTGGRRW
jgi:hypothetical protein